MTLLSRWRQARTDRPDAGVTLAELTVTMAVGTMVLGAAAAVVGAGIRSNAITIQRVDTVNTGKVAMDAMTRSLRTAVLPSQLDDITNTDAAFLVGTSNSVSFYANLQNDSNTFGPSRVSYTISGGNLTQTVQRPNAHAAADHDYTYCTVGTSGCVAQTTLLSPDVSSTGSLFTYYGTGGTPLALSASCAGVPCLAGVDLVDVDAVELRIAVQQRSGQARPTTYISRVSLPNHDAVPRVEATP